MAVAEAQAFYEDMISLASFEAAAHRAGQSG